MTNRVQNFLKLSEAQYRYAVLGVAVLVFGGAVFALADGNSGSKVATTTTTTTTEAPPSTTSSSTQPERVGIEGYDAIAFSITTPTGEVRDHCGLLAESDEQLANGMKGQSDFGGYDGMIFRFSEDRTSAFYMANVPIPLSIAWFDAVGGFVSSTDMAVCEVAEEDCPLYEAAGPFRYALETPVGAMGDLGVGTNSVLEVGGPCA